MRMKLLLPVDETEDGDDCRRISRRADAGWRYLPPLKRVARLGPTRPRHYYRRRYFISSSLLVIQCALAR